ncbi:S8 family serine peptidase [Spirillospora sp. NPDC052269]
MLTRTHGRTHGRTRILRRGLAAALAAALTTVLAPPLAPAAHADTLDPSVKQMLRDLRDAGRQTHGGGTKIALLSDGVADVLAKGVHVQDEKDFIRTAHPKREQGTLLASVMFGGEGGIADAGELALPGLIKDAELLPVRVQPDDGPGGPDRSVSSDRLDRALGDGMRYAVDHGARVIAVAESWMYDRGRAAMAIAYAQSKDVLVVAPVGIRKPNEPGVFTSTPGVLGVGDVDRNGDRYDKYSQASSALLVSAYGDRFPGVGSDGSGSWTFWGDGPALAFVASAAVMVRAAYPKLTAAQVTEAITSSARHPKGHYTTDLGFGYLNASGALTKAATMAKRPPPAEKADRAVAGNAHFGGKAPGRVRAVPVTLPWFGGFGVLAGVGVLMIGAAVWLIVRRRPAVGDEAVPPPPVPDEA